MAENPYESTKLLGEYLLFHYGKPDEILPWSQGPVHALEFPRRTVETLIDQVSFRGNSKALDVGCAVGASSFVLAQYFDHVLGIDYSKKFIDTATTLKRGEVIEYEYLVEGDFFAKGAAVPPEHRGTIDFQVGDADDLPNDLMDFDLVHAANLICRLPNPKSFLNRLPSLIRPGGQLLLATPFTWMEEFTVRENWIGSGNSKEILKEILQPFFELEFEEDLPFLIREHQRKFQYSVSWGTRWRRM